MNSKALVGSFPSIVATLGVNAIPAGGLLVAGWSAETAMVIYFLENIVAVLLACARVLIIPSVHDAAFVSNTRDHRTLVKEYFLVAIGFSLASAVFLSAFIFLILRAEIPFQTIVAGMTGIIAFQFFGFVCDLLLLRPLPLSRAEDLLRRSLGRVFLLHLAVFVGMFAAAFADRWFVLPFVALKTAVDVGGQIQFLINWGRAQFESASNHPSSNNLPA